MKIQKTYHIHVENNPHWTMSGRVLTCWEVSHTTGWIGCRGHKFSVQTIHRTENGESGCVNWGTCSRIKLWLYLRWLNLRGYKKDKRTW